MPEIPKKTINSVMLICECRSGDPLKFENELSRLLDKYDLQIEFSVESSEEDGSIIFRVDFSDECQGIGTYFENLTLFLNKRMSLLEEIVAFDDRVAIELSTQIVVDQSLSVFTVMSPRMSAGLSSRPNFQFGYSVWHVLEQ